MNISQEKIQKFKSEVREKSRSGSLWQGGDKIKSFSKRLRGADSYLIELDILSVGGEFEAHLSVTKEAPLWKNLKKVMSKKRTLTTMEQAMATCESWIFSEL